MELQIEGFYMLERFVQPALVKSIIDEVARHEGMDSGHGIRNAEKKFQSINDLVNSRLLRDKAASILGSEPSLVRAIFFDKIPGKNWLVTWHQDKTIALDRQADIPGWGPWSVKEGVHHVQPDISVLNQMITFRLHLDDADESNGCLKVIPQSHAQGILAQDDIFRITQTGKPYSCSAKAGDMLVMRPHILHASGKAINPLHRRIVHVEYSNYALPQGLLWA